MGALEIIVLADTILIVVLMIMLYLLKKHVDKLTKKLDETSLNHNRKIQMLEELMNIYITYEDDADS